MPEEGKLPRPIPGELHGPPLYSRALPIIMDQQEKKSPAIHHNPPAWSSKLWRYMKLEHFEDFLRRGIYLARADVFPDRLEGTLPIRNEHGRAFVYANDATMRDGYKALALEFERMKSWTFISCWRVDGRECARCWREYPERDVAVQTTYFALSRLTAFYFCASVEYIEHGQTWIPEGNTAFPFIFKDRQRFEWENEFRIIEQRFPFRAAAGDGELRRDCSREPPYKGRFLAANPINMIQQIVLSPNASSTCRHKVTQLASKAGLLRRVRSSGLGRVL